MEDVKFDADDTGAIAAGDVHIEGGQFAAGRDIIIENYSESDWIRVNLSPYSQGFISPIFTESLIYRLKENGLLILSGGLGFDKNEFSKYLAWRVSKDIVLPAHEKGTDDTKPKNLFAKIKQWEERSIFILSEFSPKDVGFDIEKLSECGHGKHFIILTTDLSLNAWQLQPHQEKKYWFEIPSTKFYEQETITAILIDKLNKTISYLEFEQNIKQFTPETQLLCTEPVSVTAQNFQTPEQVRLFTELLSIERQPITEVAIKELLKSFNNKNESLVSKWFRNLSSEREKLLVIAAALLDGVYEDQFFEILKEITEAFWHYRDPSLYALDYGDLEFLMNFFRFDDETGRGAVLRGRFPFQRADILRCAWQSHRRHITSAIPVLNNIAQQSRYTGNMKKDLYSNRQRRMVLREVIAETFSDMGIMHLPSVEDKLLRLAAQNDDSLHRVVAKAIVRWKLLGKEEQLYNLIWKWLGNEDASNQIADILQENNSEQKTTHNNKAKRYLHKVVILTMEYIIESEPPNRLSLKVIELVNYLINETPDTAIELYRSLVSKLLLSHFHQIKPLFSPEFITDKSRSSFIAEGMMAAYEEHAVEVRTWLDEWMELCLDKEYDNALLLKTLLQVYCTLSDEDSFDFSQAWEKIKQLYLLKKEGADKILFFKVIQKLCERDIENSLAHIKFLVNYSTIEERQEIMKCLVEVYKKQRASLSGATAYIEVKQHQYPYWYNSTRPRTTIETIMFKWIHSDNQFTRDIALLALAEFAIEFDKWERFSSPVSTSTENKPVAQEFIYRPQTIIQTSRRPAVLAEPHISLYSRIVISFLLLFETRENRIIIRQYIKTFLQHPFVSDSEGIRILVRNLRVKPTQRTLRIARWLERLYNIR